MEQLKQILPYLLVVLFALWNGVSIQFYNTKDIKYNKYYHQIGFLIRGLTLLILWGNWIQMLILLNISWSVYDIIIAKIMKQPMFYIGKTAWIDKTFGYFVYFPKVCLCLLTVYLLIK